MGRPDAFTVAFGAIAIVYLGLAAFAFITGGFSLRLGPIEISATAPQKMLRIAAGIAGMTLAVHLYRKLTREQAGALISRCWPLAAGFFIGYLPVLLYSVFVEPARSPARNANLTQLLNAAPDIFGNVVPILSGFKIATTERLALPVIAALPAIASLAAYLWSNRGGLGRLFTRRGREMSLGNDFFPLFVVFVPALFLVSGAYVDTQSYRYLIPWYAGLAVAWAAGSLELAAMVPHKPDPTGARTIVASIIVAAILAVHAWQQVIWYRKLQPDTQLRALIGCMKENGIRGGYAEYWTAYRLTFLADEELIIAPTDGVDRYPRYTEFVRSLPSEMRMDDAARCN